MVTVNLMDGSRKSVQVDGGGTGRGIIVRVMEPVIVDGKVAGLPKTLAVLSLSADEAEAIENALRIRRRASERK